MRRAIVAVAVAVAAVGLWIWLELLPHRPANVPKTATPVSIPWGYDWDYCWFNTGQNISRCQIFNKNGDLLYDDAFLPYEGKGPISGDDLKIRRNQDGGGEEWIYLENGTMVQLRQNQEGT
jgi:hypothetical protein